MKKIILFFLLLVLAGGVRAEGIRFVENKKWKEVLALARKENKLIFLDAYASWCGPCAYMQKDVFPAAAAGAYFNAHFINVKLDMEKGEGPLLSEQLNLTAYPTLYFLNAEGEVVHKYVGALEPGEFVALGKEALNPQTQFYTLKKETEAGSLAPRAVHDWVHAAEKLKEEGLDSTLYRYLAATAYPLLEKEMLALVKDHVSLVPQKQLHTLFDQRAAFAQLTGRSEAEVDDNLLAKLRQQALETSVDGDSIHFARYRQVVAAYLPRQADGELQRVKVKYYFFQKDPARGLAALARFIDDRTLGLSARGLSELVTAYAGEIVAHHQEEAFLKRIEGFRPEEKKQDFHKDIALWALHRSAGNSELAEHFYTRVLTNDGVPTALRDAVRRLQEEE